MRRETYTPWNHKFVTHPTYTGSGCAMCGRPFDFHIIERWSGVLSRLAEGPSDPYPAHHQV